MAASKRQPMQRNPIIMNLQFAFEQALIKTCTYTKYQVISLSCMLRLKMLGAATIVMSYIVHNEYCDFLWFQFSCENTSSCALHTSLSSKIKFSPFPPTMYKKT
uniref:Uncharacterized protein n=1 Tax=Glossina austeni TaxID=7395 RepID=A0A1A9V5J2_GLOAU